MCMGNNLVPETLNKELMSNTLYKYIKEKNNIIIREIKKKTHNDSCYDDVVHCHYSLH